MIVKRDPLAFGSSFGYLNLFKSIVLPSALVATMRQPEYVSATSTRNIEHLSNSMSRVGAEGELKKVEFMFCGFSGQKILIIA
jgi:hypothetical protein